MRHSLSATVLALTTEKSRLVFRPLLRSKISLTSHDYHHYYEVYKQMLQPPPFPNEFYPELGIGHHQQI